MAVYLFRSTDADAPRLSGTAGDLTNLLQKCLVDGYNALTGVSVTRSGATATFNKTAHGFVTGQRVRHSGFTETEYNVDARVTRIDADNWSITVSGTPTTPGATTGSAKMCPLDWTAAYTGTNKTAFRQKTTGMNGFYLRVDDAAAQQALLRGYETMSDVDTGTGLFPTIAQVALASGPYLYKSSAASTAARAWTLYSPNGKIFYLFFSSTTSTFPGGTSAASSALVFGDGLAASGSDNYATFLFADATTTGNIAAKTIALSAFATVTAGHYAARTAAGTGSAIQCGKRNDYGVGAASIFGAGLAPYPHPTISGIVISKTIACDTTSGDRALLPGLWSSAHPGNTFSHGDTFSGATGTPLSGKTFEIIYMTTSTPYNVVIETSDTVDTAYG